MVQNFVNPTKSQIFAKHNLFTFVLKRILIKLICDVNLMRRGIEKRIRVFLKVLSNIYFNFDNFKIIRFNFFYSDYY